LTIVPRNDRFGVKVWDRCEKQYRWVGSFDTEAEARLAEADALPQPSNRSPTVEQWGRIWLTDYARDAPATQLVYAQAVKSISRAIGGLRLDELDRPSARRLANTWPRNTSAVVRTMWEDARRDGVWLRLATALDRLAYGPWLALRWPAMPDQTKQLQVELDDLHSQGMRLRALLLKEAEPTAFEELRELITTGLLQRSGLSNRQSGKARAPEERKPGESAERFLAGLEVGTFGTAYQHWYSTALRVISQLLPERYEEFQELYRPSKPPKELVGPTYTISDYLKGTRVRDGLGGELFDAGVATGTKLQNQVDILGSAATRLDSALSDITGIVEAALFDDELSAARELLKAKHLRSAGIVAGVVLEAHLKRLVQNHGVQFKKTPQIGSLNEALKGAKVYDVPTWRQIQRLGDIRNLCGHAKEREPKQDEVEDLISGVEKITATVF
jgi:hypothetical protein